MSELEELEFDPTIADEEESEAPSITRKELNRLRRRLRKQEEAYSENKQSVDLAPIFARLTGIETAIAQIHQQESDRFKVQNALLEKIVQLAIEADDSPDIAAARELITSLSQHVRDLATDMKGLKETLADCSSIEELFDKLKVVIEEAKAPSKIPEEKAEKEVEKTWQQSSPQLELFGNVKNINGTIEIIKGGYSSGVRTVSDSIESPGEYFQYRFQGKGVVGISAFPRAANSWSGTDYSFYHIGSSKVAKFVGDKFEGSDRVKIEDNQLLRLAIAEDKRLLWQLVDDSGEAHTVFATNNSISNKFFFYAVPFKGAKLSDIEISKIG